MSKAEIRASVLDLEEKGPFGNVIPFDVVMGSRQLDERTTVTLPDRPSNSVHLRHAPRQPWYDFTVTEPDFLALDGQPSTIYDLCINPTTHQAALFVTHQLLPESLPEELREGYAAYQEKFGLSVRREADQAEVDQFAPIFQGVCANLVRTA